MRPDVRLLLIFTLSLAMDFGAGGNELGGGASLIADSDSYASGNLVADNTGASSVMYTNGPLSYAGLTQFVEDSTGKRAEMSFDVTDAAKNIKCSSLFFPRKGELSYPATVVMAMQMLSIPQAGSINLHAAAYSTPGANEVGVDLAINKIDSPSSPASFSGSTQSLAGYVGSLAKVQGTAVGSIDGTAFTPSGSKTRSSGGEKVSVNLLMQASSMKGVGDISGASTFGVDDDLDEKIQSAINAAWDGDTINVAGGDYKENVVVDKSLTINGAGASRTTINGTKSGSVFTIGKNNPNINVALSNMMITGGSSDYGGGILNYGRTKIKGCMISGNSADKGNGYGGGIYNGGTAAIASSTISDNIARNAGGIFNYGTATIADSIISRNTCYSVGGGIFNYEGSTMTISSSTISDNDGYNNGGGIFNWGTATIIGSKVSGNYALWGGGIFNTRDSTVTITGSTISSNIATRCNGGGIYNLGTATISGSTISGNTARYGGGISNSGTSTITGSTISGNIAQGISGGIWNGGGIWNVGTATISRSTISGNTANSGFGGGISNFGTSTMIGSTISGNSASHGGGISSIGTATITGSTISGNIAQGKGGGISISGNLIVNGKSRIISNEATTGHGGGIYIWQGSSVTLDGQSVIIGFNKAALPSPSEESWYRGWGVYSSDNSIPIITGRFNPKNQVIRNTKL